MQIRLGVCLFLVFAAPAKAHCLALPDGPGSSYVENGTGRAVCLQDELAASTQRVSPAIDLDNKLQALRLESQREQQRLLALQQQLLTRPGAQTFPTFVPRGP